MQAQTAAKANALNETLVFVLTHELSGEGRFPLMIHCRSSRRPALV